MKRFYLKSRIALMTFALGLASVFVFNGSLKFPDEIQVNLPEVESESPIIVFQADALPGSRGGGGAGGGISYNEIQVKTKVSKFKSYNCD